MKKSFGKFVMIFAIILSGAPALVSNYLSSEESNAGELYASTLVLKGPLCASAGGTFCCKDTATTDCSQNVGVCSKCS